MQETQAVQQSYQAALVSRMLSQRVSGQNVWLSYRDDNGEALARPANQIKPEVLNSEEAVGRAQLEELKEVARAKEGDVVMILLGGRGAQAMYRIVGELAQTPELDELLGRLHVFTQDALAPMRMDNSLSFVRDFERLLGDAFFQKVKSFTPMQTQTDDLEAGLTKYIDKLEMLGGVDIFFLGLGPEANAASHLCYIKPGCGATVSDFAGIIPISPSILEHHIKKFKVGGSAVTERDEAECRAATHILTLGPAAILSARRIVQSIVDASTAPAKRECYARFLETELADDRQARAKQLDENPGLWLRLHPNVRSLVLPDVMN
jgi:6-phosphogluconolactonase/glucosamine-6-phosphate isomerase/deaminase